MNGSRGKRIALFAALGVMLIAVGVLVWPEPKEARAENTIFNALVEWLDGDPHTEGVTLYVRTYFDSGHLTQIREVAMIHQGDDGEFSMYLASFALNTNELYWGVYVVIMDSEIEMVESNPCQDDDPIEAEEENDLDQTIHFSYGE